MKNILHKLKKIIKGYKLTMFPSGMAFYLMFALVPSLTLLQLFFQIFNVPGDLLQSYLSVIFPKSIAISLIDFLSNGHSWTGFLMIALNIIVSVFIISNGFNAFIVASNSIYKKKKNVVNRRLRSMLLALSFVGLIFMFFFINSIVAYYIYNKVVSSVLRIALMAILIMFMCMLLYSISGTKFNFGKVWVGSVVATVGISLILSTFTLYSKYFSKLSNSYGPLTWLLVLMLGLYFIGVCLHIGLLINAMFDAEIEERFKTQQQKIIITDNQIQK